GIVRKVSYLEGSMTRTRGFAVVAAFGCLGLLAASAPGLASSTSALIPRAKPQLPRAEIRVDQVGFLPGEIKHAHLMAAHRLDDERFSVVDSKNHVVLRGRLSKPVDTWNRRYHAVYDLNLTQLRKPGRYQIQAYGDVTARSPYFQITTPYRLFGQLL